MRNCLILLAMMVSMSGFGQNIQWADQVLEVSSQYNYVKHPGQYQAAQALGPPSSMPGGGANECAWSPAFEQKSGGEFIRLGFSTATNVRQIAIHENFNAGAIKAVFLFDEKGRPHEVYNNPVPDLISENGRLWNLFIESTPYKVKAIKILLKTTVVPGFNQIDAVAISDAEDSIKVAVRLAEGWDLVEKSINLGPNINTPYNDLCPVISADGKTLYFTRMGDPNNLGGRNDQDIWYSQVREDGTYSVAKNMGDPLNNRNNNSITSITPDGQTAALLNRYEADGSISIGVSTANRSGEEFAFPRPCEIKNFYNNNDYGEYCLSSSGKMLIMTLQRDDSKGGKDLYMSELQPDGNWSEPKSLGASLNTSSNETSPFLAADDRTLYFSTGGFPGFGKKDMFLSRRLDDTWTNWSEPLNLGPKLNSPNWDAYYSIPASGEYAYFVSYENSIGEADIFRVGLPQAMRPLPVVLVSGVVRDKKTNKPLAARIVYESLSSEEEVGEARSDPRDGTYSIALPAGTHYGFRARGRDYLPVSENLDLSDTETYQEIKYDLYLVAPEAGAIVKLNNLFFDQGKSELRPDSENELLRLLQIMDEYPTMSIEISGHTDDIGTAGSNLKLSQERANSVMKYLLGKGVLAARIKAVGYGETKPEVANDSEENRQRNRRVEFKIRTL
jgi:outer membrane protein OmpA-like peptidoglycan-associated protein